MPAEPGSLGGLYADAEPVMSTGVCIVPTGSPARRPTVAAFANSFVPAVQSVMAAWPWPDTLIVGTQ